MKIYSIYDKVMGEFNSPFVAKSDEVASRSFHMSLEKAPVPVGDLALYSLGDFDSETGDISPTRPILICEGENSEQ